MALTGYLLENIEQFVGQDLGVSDWLTIDQGRINQFAVCTNDDQWIHTDIERAKKESPLGTTLAHGFLLLSLLADFQIQSGLIPSDAKQGLNYGLDKVRFLVPVIAGARVRNRMVIAEVIKKEKGVLLKVTNTMEIEGQDSPALIAETLAMLS